jgi:hypothetical protein
MARHIRVTSIAFSGVEPGADHQARTRDKMADYLEQAAVAKPDLVILPEIFNLYGLPVDQWPEAAETIPGPLTDRAAEIAARHRMYICVPTYERDGDRLYNTAAFIDREGRVIGKYHKYQPTVSEMELGVVPGVDAEAFETDFGRVGAAICFDLKFVEVGQHLAANGARLVCFPSAFIGGERLQHWARDFGFYLLTANNARCYLVDMSGRMLGSTGYEDNQVRWGYLPPILSGVINMDRMFFHLDGNQLKFQELIKKYGAGLEFENHHPEAFCTIASLMEEVTMEDIVHEFELEPWNTYLARARSEHLRYLTKAGCIS